jgi:putative (di)nucleoside polyphosphate hydrolase
MQTGSAAGRLPYRPCVGVAVFNREGLVWTGRRIAEPDSEYAGTAHLWQMPQGGIDAGENPIEAAKRELYEETGIESVSLLAEAPDWINYDLPAHLVGVALQGRFCGQTQRWFAFRFDGEESEIRINPTPGGHKPEFDDWAWRSLRELPGLVVPFKRKLYEEVARVLGHLAA